MPRLSHASVIQASLPAVRASVSDLAALSALLGLPVTHLSEWSEGRCQLTLTLPLPRPHSVVLEVCEEGPRSWSWSLVQGAYRRLTGGLTLKAAASSATETSATVWLDVRPSANLPQVWVRGWPTAWAHRIDAASTRFADAGP